MKHKTRTERVYNEATGWYETREVELKAYRLRLSSVFSFLYCFLGAKVRKLEISSKFKAKYRNLSCYMPDAFAFILKQTTKVSPFRILF